MRGVTEAELREQLVRLQDKSIDNQKFRLWKGKGKA